MTPSTTKPLLLLAAAAVVFAPVATAQRGDETVLRALTQGTDALLRGEAAASAQAFDLATGRIAEIWSDSPDARRARSLWYEERVKPFKGEPYERMMAFYYRGLLYLRVGDFGNAQASFRNAVMQDAFAEEEQNRADAALPLFLQGWALAAQGSIGPARDAFREVQRLRPGISLPDLDGPRPNVLLLIETGLAPRKVPDGVGAYRLRFFPGRGFQEARAEVTVGSTPVLLFPIESVLWQASSRGGRPVDAIVEGKAAFAQRTGNAGAALSDLATAYADQGALNNDRTASVAGDVLGLVGIAALALSSRAKPAADVRYWDNLPDAVHVACLTLPPGRHRLALTFRDADGTPLPDLAREVDVDVAAATPSVAWFASRTRPSRYLSATAR